MSITRVTAAELFSTPHEFSPREEAAFAELTDEEITKRALSDPDARPSTPEMLLRGRQNRESRLRMQALRDASLGARLSRAEADLDLPLFEITDEHGRTILLKASACREVTSPHDPTARVLKLEGIAAERAARSRIDEADARIRSTESHRS